MQPNALEVVIDRSSAHHSFVTVSKSYMDTALLPLYAGSLPASVPLRLTLSDSKHYVYVGCLTQRPHQSQKYALVVPHALAHDLGLIEGQLVECLPLSRGTPRRATKVLVAPLTVDDSEVVELNALRIESQLLRQVQVVFPGMTITVAVFPGVQAKVRVQNVECGEHGDALTEGCAVMFEGTHFIIATRARQQQQQNDAEGGDVSKQAPTWAILRIVPPATSSSLSTTVAAKRMTNAAAARNEEKVHVAKGTAERYGWTDGALLDALDLASLTQLPEPKITPAFLRANQIQVRLAVVEEKELNAVSVCPQAQHVCMAVSGCVKQPTNLLLGPPMRTDNGDAQDAAGTAASSNTAASKSSSSGSSGTASVFSLETLAEVHGEVPGALLAHLRFVFSQPTTLSMSGNVLLCGGKGYGKTAVTRGVLAGLPGVRSVWLECAGAGKAFLPDLRRAVVECALCAPSVLVLDNFDAVASEQKDGNVQAVSDATRAALEAALTTFTTLSPFSAPVVVLATCCGRESVHASMSSALCFSCCVALPALTRVTRRAMLAQVLPPPVASAANEDVTQLLALVENYTPFDLQQVSARILRGLAESPSSSLLSVAETSVANFTPLAHTGITFLKGDKVDWAGIGGLAEAKKVLYDTLVLPMRHPQLFARLPLKTRSGILLYGASGCGKTFILDALVKTENLNCIVVNGPEVFGKYIGQSEQKIRDVFERAQAAAPCVVFFDEFDSVAPQRGVDNSGVTDRVVNQLLCYLDGVEGRKDVFVVAASSRPDLIDAALLRPGRLDKAVVCPIPDNADRVAILQSLLSDSTTITSEEVDALAQQTENWTPADLAAMVSTANTMVSQRMMERITRAREEHAAAGAAEEEDIGAVITDVGSDVAQEQVSKLKDALAALNRATLGRGAAARSKAAMIAETLTVADLEAARRTTRPSLSAKDILRQKRIHALFSKGETEVPVAPGTKMTFS